MCGEHWNVSGLRNISPGSSPRVRGTFPRAPVKIGLFRFIPACAGNIRTPAPTIRTRAVHPRVCGEHDTFDAEARLLYGSSPRVRGTLPQSNNDRRQCRFIPACAGNIHFPLSLPLSKPVHPRVCGEHIFKKLSTLIFFGSSPRVRGTFAEVAVKAPALRFIPACAGNILPEASQFMPPSVHPRVCGEHFLLIATISVGNGSSPRVRGTSERQKEDRG